MGTVRLFSLFMLLFLLQCGSISAREQEFPVDTVDMSDYRILPIVALHVRFLNTVVVFAA